MTCEDVRDLAAGFVLGALTPGEAGAVRDHLATCVEAHSELAELGGVVPYLIASVDPVEPPATLRGRILAAAVAERPATGAGQVELAAPPTRAYAPAPTAVPTPAARVAAGTSAWGAWAMRIAAVLVLAALGAWNLQPQGRLSGVEDDLAAAKAYQEGVATVLMVAAQPGARSAILRPTDPGTTAIGLAAAGRDGVVIISMHDLAPTTGGQVYEAWVIVGDAAPVPLGGFTVGDAGTGVFHGSTALAEPGAILALTLEPGPGATTPTLPVLTLGALTSST